MHSENRLDGKIALISGASKGLGKSMAQALSACGARVALVARNETQLQEVQTDIETAGGAATSFKADVSKESDVIRLEKEVSARMGKIQILINNAGTNIRKNLVDF